MRKLLTVENHPSEGDWLSLIIFYPFPFDKDTFLREITWVHSIKLQVVSTIRKQFGWPQAAFDILREIWQEANNFNNLQEIFICLSCF